MSNNELHLPAQQQVSEEKKNAAFKKLVERGKQSGHLSAQEIDNVIVELDLDVDELEKLNEMIDSANISIVDDFSAAGRYSAGSGFAQGDGRCGDGSH